MTHVPAVALRDGRTLPQLGLGVFQVPAETTEQVVSEALAAGYRHIDTAQAYGNEAGVGAAVRAAGLPREELFVTTKLWNTVHARGDVAGSLEAGLDAMGLDAVDLFLVHWPLPMLDRYVDVWRAMEKLLAGGRVHSVGVSNFQPAHLDRLLQETGVVPVVNQIEMHPWLPQDALRGYHARHGIVTESWSPLGQGRGLLDEPAVQRVAGRAGCTPAQAVLAWHLALGAVAIPKTVTPARMRENLAAAEVTLTPQDLTELSSLACDRRLGPDPDSFDRH